MLIDEFLPAYDAIERHETLVRASPEKVYAAIAQADLARSPVVRLLLALRMLPSIVLRRPASGREAAHRLRRPITLRAFEERGFTILAEDPPRELLIGLVGTFWTLTGGLRAIDAAVFRGPQPPGTARAAWNFHLAPEGDACRLTTETRVQCADAESRGRFRWYWRLVGPGSGIIRLAMLRSIRRHAEGLATSGP